jgi:hypothetical protein
MNYDYYKYKYKKMLASTIFFIVAGALSLLVIPIVVMIVNALRNSDIPWTSSYLYSSSITFILSLIIGAILQIFNVFSLSSCSNIGSCLFPPSVIIKIENPDDKSVSNNFNDDAYFFIHQQAYTQQGLLLDSIKNLGMIIQTSGEGTNKQIYGIVVPIDSNNSPVMDLSNNTINENCNSIIGCMAVNLTKVLTQDQMDIIGKYVADLPQCKGGSNCSCTSNTKSDSNNNTCPIHTNTTYTYNASAITISNQTEYSSYKNNRSHDFNHKKSNSNYKHSNYKDNTNDLKSYNDDYDDSSKKDSKDNKDSKYKDDYYNSNDVKKDSKNVNVDDNLKHDNSDKKWDYNNYNDVSNKNSKYKAFNDN